MDTTTNRSCTHTTDVPCGTQTVQSGGRPVCAFCLRGQVAVNATVFCLLPVGATADEASRLIHAALRAAGLGDVFVSASA